MARVLIGNVRGSLANNLTTTTEGKGLDARQGKVLDNTKLNRSEVVSNLTTISTGRALDAHQGQILNNTKLNNSDVVNNLTTTGAGRALDARQGKVLDESKLEKSNVVNNLTTTSASYVLDARQGKALGDKSDELNRNINDHKALDYSGDRGALTSALQIDTKNYKSELNLAKQRVYSEGGTVEMPSGVILGVREYYYFNQNWHVVKITEFHPKLGRTWYNCYDSVANRWSGWVTGT